MARLTAWSRLRALAEAIVAGQELWLQRQMSLILSPAEIQAADTGKTSQLAMAMENHGLSFKKECFSLTLFIHGKQVCEYVALSCFIISNVDFECTDKPTFQKQVFSQIVCSDIILDKPLEPLKLT